MTRVKVLIFDIDLTICDNFDRKRKAIERVFGKGIGETQWSYIKYEYGFGKILKKLQIKSNHDNIINEMLNHFLYDEDLFKLDVPFKMAVDVLNRLSDKYEIYYLTGRPVHSTAVDFITKFGFPEGKIFSEKIGLGESSKKSELIREIVKISKIIPQEGVSIADLPGDALAAKKAGVVAVGTYEAHLDMMCELEELCDYVIGKIDELPEVIDQIQFR